MWTARHNYVRYVRTLNVQASSLSWMFCSYISKTSLTTGMRKTRTSIRYEQLIEEIRRYPSIWNKSLEGHRNLTNRENAWEKIANELNKTADELKYEWKKLQDSHRQALTRRKAKSGDPGNKMKPWKYEEQMAFLLDGMTPRPSQSNVGVDHSQHKTNSISIDGDEIENEADGEQSESAAQNSTKNCSKKYTNDFQNCKKRKDENIDGVLSYLRDKDKNKKPPGELDFFFASVCETTKRLPRLMQLRVKADVMKVITNAETEYLNQQLLSRSTSSNSVELHSHTPSPAYVSSFSTTYVPSQAPSDIPSPSPSYVLSQAPNYVPSQAPTHVPTPSPSYIPSQAPSHAPTSSPLYIPTPYPNYVENP